MLLVEVCMKTENSSFVSIIDSNFLQWYQFVGIFPVGCVEIVSIMFVLYFGIDILEL